MPVGARNDDYSKRPFIYGKGRIAVNYMHGIVLSVKWLILNRQMNAWRTILEYYKTISEKFHVNPGLFVGIHLVATPLFVLSVAWIIYNKRHNKSIILPSVVAALVFNASNIYLVIFGRNIPLWIYLIVVSLAIVMGFFSVRKIRNKLLRKSEN